MSDPNKSGIPVLNIGALRAPFDPSEIKRKPGPGNYPYLPGETVVRRLNEHAGKWHNVVINEYDDIIQDKGGKDIRVKCAVVRLIIEHLGEREHKGTQRITDGGGENILKGAITDGIKKAAELFGVGLKTFEFDEDEEYGENPAHSPPAANPANQANPGQQQRGTFNPGACSFLGCGITLTTGQSNLSQQKYGRPLCPTHQRESQAVNQ